MRKYRSATVIIPGVLMLFLIVNANNSVVFAADAIKLCTASLIPSLFPFIFLSTILNNALTGYKFGFLRFISRICQIPEGSEGIFLLGILSGYPIGAQIIASTYETGNLKKEDAQRMLGFCNNAGPSFIFGIVGPLFHSLFAPVLLWLIQILSALVTGALLPGCRSNKIITKQQTSISMTAALERSVKAMGLICGWVIIFRIIVGFIEMKLSVQLPKTFSVLFVGILELTNGSFALYSIDNMGLRFILVSLFLSIGGLCVALQTASAVKSLGIKTYLLAKSLQGIISLCFAYIAQYFLFPVNECCNLGVTVVFFALFVLATTILISYKKTVAFRSKLVYN